MKKESQLSDLRVVVRVNRGGRPAVPGPLLILHPVDVPKTGKRVVQFETTVFQLGKHVEIGKLRLLFGSSPPTGVMRQRGLGTEFPLRDQRYLSLAANVESYLRLVKVVGREAAVAALEKLHDVTVLQRLDPDHPDLSLRETAEFKRELLRSISEYKAFSESAQSLFGDLPKHDYSFDLSFQLPRFEAPHEFSFDFSKGDLPSNVHVLIGRNGAGKTQALMHLCHALLRGDRAQPLGNLPGSETTSLSRKPPFSQVIAISYSPFDTFLARYGSANELAQNYVYLGFRDTIDHRLGLRTTHNRTVDAFRRVLEQDHREVLPERKTRLRGLIAALSRAIDFDSIAVQISGDKLPLLQTIVRDGAVARNWTMAMGKAVGRAGLWFQKEGVAMHLSAGQQIFAFIATNIASAISWESLILIDEPELYLHPNLEITFVKMIKALLSQFSSFAVLATHSLVVTREIPRTQVHVVKVGDGIPSVSHPSFQTFGADLTAIGNYVFDNAFQSEAYKEFLTDAARNAKSLDDIPESLRDELNLSSKVFLKSVIDASLAKNGAKR